MIKSEAHIMCETLNADNFSQNVTSAINKMQSMGLKVEISYQQSDKLVSAFLIGRSKNEGD